MLKYLVTALLGLILGNRLTTLQKDKEILLLQKRIARLSHRKYLALVRLEGFRDGYVQCMADRGMKTLELFANLNDQD